MTQIVAPRLVPAAIIADKSGVEGINLIRGAAIREEDGLPLGASPRMGFVPPFGISFLIKNTKIRESLLPDSALLP